MGRAPSADALKIGYSIHCRPVPHVKVELSHDGTNYVVHVRNMVTLKGWYTHFPGFTEALTAYHHAQINIRDAEWSTP